MSSPKPTRPSDAKKTNVADTNKATEGIPDAPRPEVKPAFFKVSVDAFDKTLGCKSLDGVSRQVGCALRPTACTTTGRMVGVDQKGVVTRTVSSKTGRAKDGSFSTACLKTGKPSRVGAVTTAAAPAPAPMPVVTQSDFQSLGVKPLVAYLGPPRPWVPVGMDVVVYADAQQQTLTRTMLGQQVTIRATPIEYEWSFGDGTVLTTSFAGSKWPKKDIAAQYAFEGWYQMSLTTTFRGEYSINGGPFQPIDGTIRVPSTPAWIYADALKARLVNGPVEKKYRDVPARTKDTLGPSNPNAVKKRLHHPGDNSQEYEN